MKQYNTKMELLGSAPVSKALFALGLPTKSGMMVNALYNLVDAYFVGGLGTTQMGTLLLHIPLARLWWDWDCSLEMAPLPTFHGC